MSKLTFEEFEERGNAINNGKYKYFKEFFNGFNIPTKIECPIHGVFWQKPIRHLIYKRGCPKCGRLLAAERNIKRCGEKFIERANIVHNFKYLYHKVDYKRNDKNVEIICPIHGSFFQTPNNHLSGQGCPKCGLEKLSKGKRRTNEEFIEKANIVHNYKYKYGKTQYVVSTDKVIITCPIHGDFEQEANSHLRGVGCPKCSESHLETEIRTLLEENNVNYSSQQKFDWLRDKRKMPLDFYIEKCNLAIECQGGQHFRPFGYFGGQEKYEKNILHDRLKKKLCDENGVELVYFTHEKINGDYFGTVFNNKEELFEYIKQKLQTKE